MTDQSIKQFHSSHTSIVDSYPKRCL